MLYVSTTNHYILYRIELTARIPGSGRLFHNRLKFADYSLSLPPECCWRKTTNGNFRHPGFAVHESRQFVPEQRLAVQERRTRPRKFLLAQRAGGHCWSGPDSLQVGRNARGRERR